MNAVPMALAQQIAARDRWRCRVGGEPVHGLRGFAWSIHHRLGRGMGGTKTASATDPRFLLLVCGNGVQGCHGWLESHRTEAYAHGYSLRHTTPPTDPDTVPVIPREGGCAR